MKKIFLLFIPLLAHSFSVKAQQDTVWRKGGIATLNFNQTNLTNWAAGGENSIAASGLLNLFANYKKNRVAFDNSVDLAYGVLKPGEKDLHKNEDKIDLLSKVGYDANNKQKLFYTLLFNFKSQFTDGFNYPNDTTEVLVSRFAAPAYFLLALGLDYKPNKDLSVFLSPLTAKVTLVNDQELADAGAFGVDEATYDLAGNKVEDGKKLRTEIGAYFNLKYQKDILPNVNLLNKFDMFSNYADHPENIDISWEVLIAMKVNKLLSASISTHLIYDDNIDIQEYETRNGYRVPKVNPDGSPVSGPRVQFKEVIGIGLSYKF